VSELFSVVVVGLLLLLLFSMIILPSDSSASHLSLVCSLVSLLNYLFTFTFMPTTPMMMNHCDDDDDDDEQMTRMMMRSPLSLWRWKRCWPPPCS